MNIFVTTDLQQCARERLKSSADVKKALSIAVGIAISRGLTLPVCDDGGAAAYFTQVLSYQVVAEAALFNEKLTISIDLAEETARAFWLIRYHHAYPGEVIPLTTEEDGHFMNKINGCGHLIAPDTFAFCQENANAMVALVNRVRAANQR